jgi:hypothetical protein
MRRSLIALAVIIALAGCTSVVTGRGQRAGTSAATSSTPASSVPTASVTAPPSDWPPPDLLRIAPSTGIGDPVTADLCTAIGLAPLAGLGAELTASFDSRQYPPGCGVTLKHGTKPVLGVSVFGEQGQPSTVSGRSTRTVAGQPVYQFPFVTSTGECRRELNPLGILLTVNSFPQGDAQPDAALDCASTDAMAARLARIIAVGTMPQLPVAPRSVSALDACRVVDKAAITALPDFAHGTVAAQGFGASCEVRRATAFLFFNFVIADAARPNGAHALTVDGHRLYETSAQPPLCSYVSTQGRTSSGRYEQVAASATTSGTHPPAGLCDQTAQALARYLTAAELS